MRCDPKTAFRPAGWVQKRRTQLQAWPVGPSLLTPRPLLWLCWRMLGSGVTSEARAEDVESSGGRNFLPSHSAFGAPARASEGSRNPMSASHCVEAWDVAGLSQDGCAFVNSYGAPGARHCPTPQMKNREKQSRFACEARPSPEARLPDCTRLSEAPASDSHRAQPSMPLCGDVSALPTTNRWQQ